MLCGDGVGPGSKRRKSISSNRVRLRSSHNAGTRVSCGDRYTRNHAFVSFIVDGVEPIQVQGHSYSSWRVKRQDRLEDKSTTSQTLWYSPELCTLTQFTDSQERTVTLLRVLHPGDRDYNRAVVRRLHRLYWADTNQLVK